MDWLMLLRAQADATSITETAAKLGYSRSAISLALAGRYPGGTDKLKTAVLLKLQRLHCPHLDTEIEGVKCRENANRPMPTGNPQELKFWRACQRCPNHRKGLNNAV